MIGPAFRDLGWGRHGDVPFEWIQSLVGPSVYDGVAYNRNKRVIFSVTPRLLSAGKPRPSVSRPSL